MQSSRVGFPNVSEHIGERGGTGFGAVKFEEAFACMDVVSRERTDAGRACTQDEPRIRLTANRHLSQLVMRCIAVDRDDLSERRNERVLGTLLKPCRVVKILAH